jgi:hypothetical protein
MQVRLDVLEDTPERRPREAPDRGPSVPMVSFKVSFKHWHPPFATSSFGFERVDGWRAVASRGHFFSRRLYLVLLIADEEGEATMERLTQRSTGYLKATQGKKPPINTRTSE